MASIFTYQEEPPRVHSPWSTPGRTTPQQNGHNLHAQRTADGGRMTSITKLEPERQDGPTEYKLHLLLRPRRYQPASAIQNPSSSSANLHQAPVEVTPRANSDGISGRALPLPVNSSRQARLQQLTTQLLWRLQQSSPFHSSSNADLVLPILPEATPRLGVPDQPAKLLPGLEESQGALYEIGVADDGTLVGLVEEELEESLNNLRAMAASLGCVLDVLRRVLIAQYESTLQQHEGSIIDPVKVWVAEVLVRPDTKSPKIPPLEEIDATQALSALRGSKPDARHTTQIHVEQLRIAVIGATTGGKSSLVGTLTTSTVDNGRGKSRLSLLKHRHEIASGVTSSVAQELLGYRSGSSLSHSVVNYATGDVSSWPDIHNLASRLMFLSDSPGLPRYAKSTLRTLISWDPDWTLLCVAADEEKSILSSNAPSSQTQSPTFSSPPSSVSESVDLSLAHLDLCFKLELPMIIVVTKLDVATKSGLKTVLSKILSALKVAGRAPVVLGSPSNTISNVDDTVDIASELAFLSDSEQGEISAVIEKVKHENDTNVVPIVFTSAVTGAGIGKLHALLRQLPRLCYPTKTANLKLRHEAQSAFHVDEIFAIPPSKVYSENREDHSADQGIVLCGHVATGRLAVGDRLWLGPFSLDNESAKQDDGLHTPRSASYSIDNDRRPLSRALSGFLSKSLQIEQQKLPSTPVEAGSTFLEVHVVSLRSLRLPVRSMEAGETGTVGVQPITYPSVAPLSRARKGMVLTSLSSDCLYGYRSFAVLFSASDFTGGPSPTLILGGHAIVYVNSVRAAVKVTALALEDDYNDNDDNDDDDDKLSDPSSQNGFFSFDGDEPAAMASDGDGGGGGGCDVDGAANEQEARITFRFVNSMEWLEVGNKVLVVPAVTAAGPIAGPAASFGGLSGFAGKVCDVFT